jgi:hypothetical protein
MPTASTPHCPAGEQPAFLNGMAALHQQIGDAMGTPLECEHADGALNNTVQQTSAGLAAYDSKRNTETFTDGWHHWALTPDGLVAWDGTSAEPPPPTTRNASSDGAVASNQDEGPPQIVAVHKDDGASHTLAANSDVGSPEEFTVNSDDGASVAATANQDDGLSDPVAANQDDMSSDAAEVITMTARRMPRWLTHRATTPP